MDGVNEFQASVFKPRTKIKDRTLSMQQGVQFTYGKDKKLQYLNIADILQKKMHKINVKSKKTFNFATLIYTDISKTLWG